MYTLYIYYNTLYIYIHHLEPLCPLFLGWKILQNKALFNQNKGHLGLCVCIQLYTYIYISKGKWWLFPHKRHPTPKKVLELKLKYTPQIPPLIFVWLNFFLWGVYVLSLFFREKQPQAAASPRHSSSADAGKARAGGSNTGSWVGMAQLQPWVGIR